MRSSGAIRFGRKGGGPALLGRAMPTTECLREQTAVSKHVRVLSDAGLLIVEKRGRTRHCRLNAEPMKVATDWLIDYQAFWTDQFDNLAQHLASEAD